MGDEPAGTDDLDAVDEQLIDRLAGRAREGGLQLAGKGGLLAQLTKRLVESALDGGSPTTSVMTATTLPAGMAGNSRNGHRAKTVPTEVGPAEIEVPRDRDATFEPKIVATRQHRLSGVDELVISLSAGEVQAHLAEVYGAQVSRQTISTITDKVVEGMAEWQNRPSTGLTLAGVVDLRQVLPNSCLVGWARAPDASRMVSESDPLALGRAALEHAAWSQACLHFEEAAATSDAAEAWEGLSRAAWWQGDQDTTLSARERAYRAYREADDMRGAARMAMWLASDHLDFRGDDAVASAWLARGRALVGDHRPCAEAGFITVLEADIALLAHSDPVTAASLARAALDLARGIPDVGVEVVALAVLGSALVASGSIEDGLRRLDEAAALAVSEEFAERAAPGWALCHTVSACAEVGDFGRAEQWCRALHSWSATWHARHFFGVCRTAYGDVLATGGDWPTAEQELQSAVADLRTTRPALAAPTAVRLGRLRARQGNLGEARRLFEEALPLPAAIAALGELDLACDDATAAADAADRALRRLGDASVLERLPALELLARARAATGDRAGAAAVAEQVECLAERLATPYMRGRGRLVRAEVLLAGGDHDAARRSAEDAADLFGACSAPYEVAQARMLLSEALEALGRPERAEAEARCAREAFALLGTRRPRRPDTSEELSIREVHVLRLVAGGLGDAQIAERLFLSAHTVHRHVANIRTKLGVSSRAAAVGHATHHGML